VNGPEAHFQEKGCRQQSYFKLLLWINVCLCAVTLFTMIGISFFGPDSLSQHQQMLFATSEKIFTLTAGTLIGLLGGKAGG
jgi:hypothetical protein